MVLEVSLFKLQPEVTPEQVEEMMRRTRSLLLQIREVLSVKSGKKIHPLAEWPFSVVLEFESLEKQRLCHEDGTWVKFRREVIEPAVLEELTLSYELEPGRNVKYS